MDVYGFFRFDLVESRFRGQGAFLSSLIYGLVVLSRFVSINLLFAPKANDVNGYGSCSKCRRCIIYY
ncbi:DUF378 domain-containing protein [Neobacillus ginsengisoli]|uniref:DUF378 domain-containing protein n=1 Tax=Neobacillus ginsengisoli TaxID=904295 RepID=UPI0035204652